MADPQAISDRKTFWTDIQPLDGALGEAFPHVNPGVHPSGSRVLVQLRTPKKKSAGGIILTDDTRDTEKWNTQIGRVVALGDLAFRNRDTGKPWQEGDWTSLGCFVRIPMYGTDRWGVPVSAEPNADEAIFVIVNDLNVLGTATVDPLTHKAYV